MINKKSQGRKIEIEIRQEFGMVEDQEKDLIKHIKWLRVIREQPIKALAIALMASVALNAAQKGKPLSPSLLELGTQLLKHL